MNDEAASTSASESSGASDETKRKFREALERKKQGSNAPKDGPDSGSTIGGPRAKADHKREFRRKSG